MVKDLLEETEEAKLFRVEMKKAFANNNKEIKSEKKKENKKNKQWLKGANERANNELKNYNKSNNPAEIEEYARKTKLKYADLKEVNFEAEIIEKYKFIYNYYEMYIESISDDDKKLNFIEEQKLYAENNFGCFRGVGMNNIISIEGALFIGIMATAISEFIKLALSDIFLKLIHREYLISEQWDFIIASGLVIGFLLNGMYKNSKIEREDDIFNALCIRALEKLEKKINV